MSNQNTLSDIFVKFIDYRTEEYVKQLVTSVTSKKLKTMNPYVGVISFPSADFLNGQFAYQKAVQFQDSFFVGHLEMLLPDVNTTDNTKCAFTRLTFVLDGMLREFVQIANPHMDNGLGVKFSEFILRTYPRSNRDIPFNREAFHTLTDIEVSGGVYQVGDGQGNGTGFNPVNSGLGAFTPSIEFEIAISGYKCIIQ